MKKTLQVLNQLEKEGLYSRWALAGGTALVHYIGPINTDDIDVAVVLPEAGLLVSLAPLYERLRWLGYNEAVGEHVRIEGANVQFITSASGSLQDEALHARGRRVKLFGVPIRIFPLEYLMAIMLQLGRPKDRMRLAMVMSEHKGRVRWSRFRALVKKHGLTERLQMFKESAGV